jgi:hypothetical protein
MTMVMVFTCQVETMARDDAASTECHHQADASTMPFSCCLIAVCPVESGPLPGLSFVPWVVTPVVSKPLSPSFPLFIPPRTIAS